MDTESCGIASAMLGAGRETKDSGIDFAAGIIIHKKVGDYVEKASLWRLCMLPEKNYLKRQRSVICQQ